MEDLLRQLLSELEKIGDTNEEIYDTECREQMGSGIFYGSLKPVSNYVLPESFGLFADDANNRVRQALASYITQANVRAIALGITTFKQRLKAFQNLAIKTERDKCDYNDFFGYMRPDDFDEAGNVL